MIHPSPVGGGRESSYAQLCCTDNNMLEVNFANVEQDHGGQSTGPFKSPSGECLIDSMPLSPAQ